MFSTRNVCSVSLHLSNDVIRILAFTSAHVQPGSRTFPLDISFPLWTFHSPSGHLLLTPHNSEFPPLDNSPGQSSVDHCNQVLRLLGWIHVGGFSSQFTQDFSNGG